MNDKIIISICGAAGAGKSTLAKKLVQAIGQDMASRIPGDYYLKSYNGEPFEEFMKTPFKYDWDLVKKIIDIPIGLQAETPDFDFNKLMRVDKKGGKPFTIRRYMIIDTMLPYPKSNYIIKIAAPEDLRLKKVKERDKAQKLNSARNWEKMERTSEELDRLNYKYDLIVSGFDEPEVNAEKVKTFLKID